MKKKLNLRKIVFFIVFVYVVFVFISTQVTMNKIKGEIQVKQEELAKLQEKNQKLQDDINLSKTDAYIEKLARERLQMIKPNETPVISAKK